MHFFIFSASSPPSSRIFLNADDDAVGVGPTPFFLGTTAVAAPFVVPELVAGTAGFFEAAFAEFVLLFAAPAVLAEATAEPDAASTDDDPVKAPPPECAVASPVPPDRFKPAIPGAFAPTK